MCGRYVSSSPPDQLAAYFGAVEGESLPEAANFNVAPTTDVPVVLVSEGVRRVEAFHWGLVPFWAKDIKIGNRMINARAEGIATKNSYRVAFRKRRCLIPADGFYEWVKIEGEKKKQPVFITRPDGEPFAFAGLWETWRSDDHSLPLQSCTIITGAPNDKMAEINHRMPVMMPPGVWEQWLDPGVDDTDVLESLLIAAPSELITYTPVTTDVNNVRNNGPELTRAVGPADVVPTEVHAS